MDDLREQLLTLQIRRRDIIWGDSDLTDPAIVEILASVQGPQVDGRRASLTNSDIR